MNRSIYLLPTALAAALALAACNPRNDETAGRKVDNAVAGAKAGANDARQATNEAAGRVAANVTDATITTKINAGKVVLTGTAPDAGSRDRATTLSKAVDGVVEVDNRLTVKGG